MPPVRGRELKLRHGGRGTASFFDAPCAGARIETLKLLESEYPLDDAPCAGARIETVLTSTSFPFERMPPVRGRELKPKGGYDSVRKQLMPPVRGRELKHSIYVGILHGLRCPLCGGEN